MCDECMVGCRSEMPFGDHEFKNYDLIMPRIFVAFRKEQ